jgi:ribonuclease D
MSSYLVDCFAVSPAPLWEALAVKDLILHNAAFDLLFLAHLGFTPRCKVHDTMLLAQLLTAGKRAKVSLAACCQRWLQRDLDKAEQQSDWSGQLTDDQLAYAARDIEVLTPLLGILTAKVREASRSKSPRSNSAACPLSSGWRRRDLVLTRKPGGPWPAPLPTKPSACTTS